MTKEVIRTWSVGDLERLIAALRDAQSLAAVLGYHPATVQQTSAELSLVQIELSNGSKVLDLSFS